MDAIVQVEQLTRVFESGSRSLRRAKFGSLVALDNVSLRVMPGNCLALVGPNGAGKTTLLKILAGLLTPTNGRAVIAGIDVAKEPDVVRSQIGWSSNESRSFFLPISGLQNLVFFAQLQGLTHKKSRERAMELLDVFDLSQASNVPVADYSSGMCQRLSLARAMLHDPPVLLLDEPTANLDSHGRSILIQIIRDRLTSRTRSVIVATHDAQLVSELADHVLMLDQGRVIDRPRSIDPVTYLIRVSGVEASTLERFGVVTSPEDSPLVVAIEDLGDGFALAAVISELVAAGGSVLSVDRQDARPAPEFVLERSTLS